MFRRKDRRDGAVDFAKGVLDFDRPHELLDPSEMGVSIHPVLEQQLPLSGCDVLV